MPVASAYGTAIYIGDPVKFASDGTVEVAAAGDAISGVVTNIIQYKDAAGVLRRNCPGDRVPASITWTAHGERTLVQICLANAWIRFAARTDASVASLATARSLVGNNVDHEFSGTSAAYGLSGARVVIGGAGTGTAQWRIVGVTELPFVDPTAGAFQVEVMVNEPVSLPILGSSATGI